MIEYMYSLLAHVLCTVLCLKSVVLLLLHGLILPAKMCARTCVCVCVCTHAHFHLCMYVNYLVISKQLSESCHTTDI